MVRLKRSVLWACMIAIVALAVLSVYGAFLGADRAQAFFNSVPAAVYWGLFVLLLGVGIVVFRRLLWVPSLLLMHLGSILVLTGGMWGSSLAYDLQQRFRGTEIIRKGQMAILEGTSENRVMVPDSNEIEELPFEVRLRDFRIEYYEPGDLYVYSHQGQRWKLPAEAGQSATLADGLGTVTIERVFRNFKMDISGEQRIAYDAPGGSNPALEVTLRKPDGSTARRYVFLDRMGHRNPDDPLVMAYQRSVRDYVSELQVLRDGQVVASKDIEVNHPLHYGGYHFYQHSYGQNQMGDYTVLMVVSDAGLNVVYTGYAMLIAGVFWHFWVRRFGPALKARRTAHADRSGPSERPVRKE